MNFYATPQRLRKPPRPRPRRHGAHAARSPRAPERHTAVGIAVVMALGIAGGLALHDDGKAYAWDNDRWEYAGDAMVCKRPQAWHGEAFTLEPAVRTCLSIWDPKVKEEEGDACPAES